MRTICQNHTRAPLRIFRFEKASEGPEVEVFVLPDRLQIFHQMLFGLQESFAVQPDHRMEGGRIGGVLRGGRSPCVRIPK